MKFEEAKQLADKLERLAGELNEQLALCAGAGMKVNVGPGNGVNLVAVGWCPTVKVSATISPKDLEL